MLLRMELGTSSLMLWYFSPFFFQILFQFVFSIFGDLFSHFVPSLVFGRLMN